MQGTKKTADDALPKVGEYYSTIEIGKMLDVTPSTVWRWIKQGRLNAYNTPGGHRRVPIADLREFIIKNDIPVPTMLSSAVIKLLVIDDHAKVLSSLDKEIKSAKAPIELIVTTSGIDAIMMMDKEKPDAALIDLNMREVDGLALVRRLAQKYAGGPLKVLTMTDSLTAKATTESAKAGAMGCLKKPIKAAMLMKLLK